jgi:hypothetical protein
MELMLRHPHPRLLAATVLAAVVLSGSTVAAAAPPTPATGTKPMLNEVVHRETVACTAQRRWYDTTNYRGTADIEMTMSDDTVTVTVLNYMITTPRKNPGNKANINVEAHGSSGAKSKAKSPDAMKQDEQWHDLFLSTQVPRGTRTTDSYTGRVHFVFDEDLWGTWVGTSLFELSCTSDWVVFPGS